MSKSASGVKVDNTAYKLATQVGYSINLQCDDLSSLQSKSLVGLSFLHGVQDGVKLLIDNYELLEEEDPAFFIPYASVVNYQSDWNHAVKDKNLPLLSNFVNLGHDVLSYYLPDNVEISNGCVPLDDIGINSSIFLGSLLNLAVRHRNDDCEINDVKCSGVYYSIVVWSSGLVKVIGCEWFLSGSDIRIIANPDIRFKGLALDLWTFMSETNRQIELNHTIGEDQQFNVSYDDGFDITDD